MSRLAALLVLLVGLTGCGGGDPEEPPASTPRPSCSQSALCR